MEPLHSNILGQGRPLVILHGFLGMSDNWKGLGKQYAEQGLQVHLIDQRNHGKSFHSPDFDYPLMAGDLVEYMAHHGLESALVMGHSMGGKTAMHLATSHPHLVDRLLVADIGPKAYPPEHQLILDALGTLDFDQIKSRGEADEVLAKRLKSLSIRQFLSKSLYWVEKGKLGLRFNYPVLKDKLAEVGEALPASARYQGPTLFLRGKRSDYVLDGDLPLILEHFPQAHLEDIENAGHWLHAENPKQFFEKSLGFLIP